MLFLLSSALFHKGCPSGRLAFVSPIRFTQPTPTSDPAQICNESSLPCSSGEEGVDGGGLRKEFFELTVRELARPDFGMFMLNPETRMQWISEASMESEAEWLLVGVIVGLAIYNGCAHSDRRWAPPPYPAPTLRFHPISAPCPLSVSALSTDIRPPAVSS